MALQTFAPGGFRFPPLPTGFSTAPNLSGSPGVVSTTVLKAAFILHWPATGTLTDIAFLTGTKTANGVMTVTVEGLTESALPSVPDATPVATGTVTVDTADTVYIPTAVSLSVTAGAAAAVVFSGDATLICQVAMMADMGTLALPYGLNFNVSWAAIASSSPNIALKIGGTWYVPAGCYWLGGPVVPTNYSSASAGADNYGIRFRFPVRCRAIGAWGWWDHDQTSVVKLVSTAYDQGGGTGILASATLDPERRSSNAAAVEHVNFAPVTLEANTYYRLLFENQTASNIAVYYYPGHATALDPLFTIAHLTTAKDPDADGDWTNYNNGSDGYRMLFGGIIIDQIDDGAAPVLIRHGGAIMRM